MNKEIVILEDVNTGMLRIDADNKILFEGNIWDFVVSGSSFLKLFAEMGLDVTLVNKDYDDWYVNNRFSIDT
jgi:hypothetical protein